jgi:riboflavin biosynthesis pyrimidine reductase
LDLDPKLPALAEAPVRPLVLTYARAPEDRRVALEHVAEVLVCGDIAIDWSMVLGHLAGQAILCEGGPQLMGALTAADAIDELCLTLAPVLAGPGADRITVGSPTIPRSLALAHALEENGTLLLRYVGSPR